MMPSSSCGCPRDCADPDTDDHSCFTTSAKSSVKNKATHLSFPQFIVLVFSLNGHLPMSNSNSKWPCPVIQCTKCFGSKVKKSFFRLILLTIILTLFALCYSDIKHAHLFFPTNLTFGIRSTLALDRNAFQKLNVPNSSKDYPDNVPAQAARLTSSKTEHPSSTRRLPDCIIFGVSKCGTRAALEYLKLHPDVVAPSAEINFFQNSTLYQRGISWYIQQMPLSKPHQITVEKSPDYFQNHICGDRIYAANSKIKLLLLLRDPVERLVSQYMQLAEKHSTYPSFPEWVIDAKTGEINSKLPSVNVSIYSEHISYWFQIFPRNQIHIIESRSLRVNPLDEMHRVESFLNLKPFYSSEDFYFNNSRGFYCTRIRSTAKTKCLGKSKGREHVSVDLDLLDKLYTYFKPYNENLYHILRFRFPWP